MAGELLTIKNVDDFEHFEIVYNGTVGNLELRHDSWTLTVPSRQLSASLLTGEAGYTEAIKFGLWYIRNLK